jgi:hypothetical protein
MIPVSFSILDINLSSTKVKNSRDLDKCKKNETIERTRHPKVFGDKLMVLAELSRGSYIYPATKYCKFCHFGLDPKSSPDQKWLLCTPLDTASADMTFVCSLDQ